VKKLDILQRFNSGAHFHLGKAAEGLHPIMQQYGKGDGYAAERESVRAMVDHIESELDTLDRYLFLIDGGKSA
jgi:hypothetical protein